MHRGHRPPRARRAFARIGHTPGHQPAEHLVPDLAQLGLSRALVEDDPTDVDVARTRNAQSSARSPTRRQTSAIGTVSSSSLRIARSSRLSYRGAEDVISRSSPEPCDEDEPALCRQAHEAQLVALSRLDHRARSETGEGATRGRTTDATGCEAARPYNRGMSHPDSFGARSTLSVGGRELEIFRLGALQPRYDVARLPYTLRVLLENVLRREDGVTVTARDVEAVASWNAICRARERGQLQPGPRPPAGLHRRAGGRRPRRDARRRWPTSAATRSGSTRSSRSSSSSTTPSRSTTSPPASRSRATPSSSSSATASATPSSAGARGPSPTSRPSLPTRASATRSTSSSWRASSRSGTGRRSPTRVVGTDSHTTMINGLGVLGWGVGGIEAEAAMLGEAISMLVPQVVGFRLHGALPKGATATDLVLTVTQILRQTGVVGKFVEYFGHGLAESPARRPGDDREHVPGVRRDMRLLPRRRRDAALSAAHRAPRGEGRARRGVLPGERPLARPGRARDVLAGGRARPLERRAVTRRPAAPAGPGAAARAHATRSSRRSRRSGSRRTTARSTRRSRSSRWTRATAPARSDGARSRAQRRVASSTLDGETVEIDHGAVVIAAITSCTNTSNPAVMIGAGLLAKKAVERGLTRQAVGEDEPRARLEGRDRVLREGRADAVPRGARLPHGRLRLHDLHRELRAAARGGLRGDRRGRSRRRAPSSPATATSRRASIPR